MFSRMNVYILFQDYPPTPWGPVCGSLVYLPPIILPPRRAKNGIYVGFPPPPRTRSWATPPPVQASPRGTKIQKCSIKKFAEKKCSASKNKMSGIVGNAFWQSFKPNGAKFRG